MLQQLIYDNIISDEYSSDAEPRSPTGGVRNSSGQHDELVQHQIHGDGS